jgi:hypothetical protein
VTLLSQPVRLADTRSSGGPVQPGADRCFTVGGQVGVPADALGVVLNVTAVGQTGRGWLTLYPAGQGPPATSTVNFDVHEYAIANNALVQLGSGGQVCVSAGQTASQVILDAVAYVTPQGLAEVPLLAEPQRLVDTRATSAGAVAAGTTRCFEVAGVDGVPSTASGAILNVTAVGQSGQGWLTLSPAGQSPPGTSTLNFDTTEYAIANGALVHVGNTGQVCVSAGQSASQVILDATGYLP